MVGFPGTDFANGIGTTEQHPSNSNQCQDLIVFYRKQPYKRLQQPRKLEDVIGNYEFPYAKAHMQQKILGKIHKEHDSDQIII